MAISWLSRILSNVAPLKLVVNTPLWFILRRGSLLSMVPFLNKPQTTWKSLCSWLETWYEFPDMEGLKLCLCAAATHYYAQEHPLWLLVSGNPGSGKTEIVIQSLRTLPQTRIIGNLTPK